MEQAHGLNRTERAFAELFADLKSRLRVVIDRSRWLRGAEGDSRLRHAKTGHACCMGQACEQAGLKGALEGVSYIMKLSRELIPDGSVRGVHPGLHQFLLPAGVGDEDTTAELVRAWRPDEPARLLGAAAGSYSASEGIYRANDDSEITDAERESMLIRLGQRVGIEFTFTGTPLPEFARGRSALDGRVDTPLQATVSYLRDGKWVPDGDVGCPIRAKRSEDAVQEARRRLAAYRESRVDNAVRITLKDDSGTTRLDEYLEPSEVATCG